MYIQLFDNKNIVLFFDGIVIHIYMIRTIIYGYILGLYI